jgi:hypothetical protein
MTKKGKIEITKKKKKSSSSSKDKPKKARRFSRHVTIARRVLATAKTDKTKACLYFQKARVRRVLETVTGDFRVSPEAAMLCGTATLHVMSMFFDNLASLLALSNKRKATPEMAQMACSITAKDLGVVGMDWTSNAGLPSKLNEEVMVPRYGRPTPKGLMEQEDHRQAQLEEDARMEEALQ